MYIKQYHLFFKFLNIFRRQVNGELFALTGKYFPFTGPINETYTMMVKEQQDLQAESRQLEARERATSVFERIKLRFLKRYFS